MTHPFHYVKTKGRKDLQTNKKRDKKVTLTLTLSNLKKKRDIK